MSAAEFDLQFAEYQRQPWGDVVAETAGAMVATMLASIHRAKDAPPAKVSEFMPFTFPQEVEAAEERSDGASFFTALTARQVH